jgi:thiosulfate dehydrogenase [quinone] large subunit
MSALRPGAALLPLRLFLGVTFIYAGVQKLTDPGFLHQGAPTYIGSQLHGFANGTPGGFLLRALAIPHPALAGVGVAIFEIVVGLMVATGLMTRWAAAGGMALNLVFFLTASWHTTPYFLGSDIVFVFAWLPFVLSGAAGQPAFDNMLERPPESLTRRTRLNPSRPMGDPVAEAKMTRRVLIGEMATAGLIVAGISALVKGPYTGPVAKAGTLAGGGSGGGGGSAAGGGTEGSANAASRGGSSAPGSSLPQGAVRLGPGKRLPKGAAATYADPESGSPDILIRQSDGSLKAFSAVCTHAGCTVGYDGSEIYCPCHGGTYNAETGEVEGGPPPEGLAPKTVVERGGQIYAVPS